jgi:hypothetical protein
MFGESLMKNHRLTLALALGLVILAIIAPDVRADISNTAVLFLRIAPGSRPGGMGEAYVALAEDATATHWNPAGLGRYPLASTWLEAQLPSRFGRLKAVAALSTGGDADFRDYDVWCLTDSGLVRYDHSSWQTGETFHTRTDETVEMKVREYINITDDEHLARIIDKVAAANNAGSFEELEQLRDRVMNNVPEGYGDKDALARGFDTLLASYNLCLIKWDYVAKVEEHARNGLKDSVFTTEEVERINFSLEKSVGRFVPEDLIIPYSAALAGKPTDIASNGDILLIATENGLMQYSGLRWQRLTTEGGLPSNTVTCLRAVGSAFIIGTDSGVTIHNGLTISSMDAVDSLPLGRVEAVGGLTSDDVYAVVNGDLYHYDGKTWSNTVDYTVVLDDSPRMIADKHALYGTEDEERRYITKLAEVNRQTGDSNQGSMSLEPGTTIRVPYLSEIKGVTRSILVDREDRVWLGTDHGVLIFDGTEWSLPGYSSKEIEDGTTLDNLAVEKSAAADAYGGVEGYRALLEKLNGIAEGQSLEAGQEILVYANPSAAPVTKLTMRDDRVYVATTVGLLEWYEGKWARANVKDLDHREIADIATIKNEVWFASTRKVVTRAEGRSELSLMHVKWLPELADDLYYEFLSFVKSTDSWGTFGGNVTYLSYGSITRTLEDSPQEVGTFDSFDFALTLSYGAPVTSKLAWGASAKVIYSKLADQGQGYEQGSGTSTGFAVDMGILYQWTRRLSIGAALTNLGPKMTYIDAAQSDDLPRNLAIGFAYRLLESQYNSLIITAEANKILVGLNDGIGKELVSELVLNGGAEFMYANLFAVRAGYIYDKEGRIKTMTLGAGLRLLDRFRFDFAYIPSNDNVSLANTLRVSLSIMP